MQKFQVGINLTVVNSKGMSAAEKQAILAQFKGKKLTIDVDGQKFVTDEIREFSTGSIGYFTGGKVVIGG